MEKLEDTLDQEALTFLIKCVTNTFHNLFACIQGNPTKKT